jgi:hypothetical protein
METETTSKNCIVKLMVVVMMIEEGKRKSFRIHELLTN